MKRKHGKSMTVAICLLAVFAAWTAALLFIDVEKIGPQGTAVGFASLNRIFHNLTGVHPMLYVLTDWMSLVPAGFVCGFAIYGLLQWIRHRSILRVDRSILILGIYYMVVLAVYLLFEVFVVNFRPVLIDGCLEPSYPSSTTVLVLCVMLTSMSRLNALTKRKSYRRIILFVMKMFVVFMVAGRLFSGVHWLTDIIGGVILSCGLVSLYDGICYLLPDDN